MSGDLNRRWLLRSYPDGVPALGNFELVEMPVADLGDGEVLVRVTHLSMDPFPRLRMAPRSVAGPPMPLGEVVDSRGVGQVVASRCDGISEGSWVSGDVGWQQFAALRGASARPIDVGLGPPEQHLGVLGPSGLTAYFTMRDVAAPRAAETVVIAPAAGSVGSLAGQIARLAGARVVGIGRGARQTNAIREAPGFSAAIDSHSLDEGFADSCPQGVDVFLDGVGGSLHEGVVARLNARARVVLLGFVSAYNDAGPPRYGSALPILFKRASMEGFLLADWAAHFEEALAQLAAWVHSGVIVSRESIWDGLELAPEAFASLFGEAPMGKQIVRVSGETQ